MPTLAIHKDNLEELRGGRTVKAYAESISVDSATMSRLLTGKAAPGPKVIAGFIANYPFPFDHFFFPTDAE